MVMEDRIVSGAPKEIYNLPGSLYEFHSIINDQKSYSYDNIEYMFNIYDGKYYRNSAVIDMILDNEDGWGQSLIDKYNSEKHCHSAASSVIRLSNAIINNSIIYFKNGDDYSILYETYRFPDRVGKTLIFDEIEEGMEYYGSLDKSYLYIGSAGSFNYGHWLVDDLPRAKAWIELNAKHGINSVVLLPSHGEKMNDIRMSSLKCLINKDICVEFVDIEDRIKIKNLYFATPVSFHPRIKNPASINFIREKACALYSDHGFEAKKRLFVARRPPNSRSIINFDEVWNFLKLRGFEMVEPEKLDFVDQVKIFREAEIVVGQMGAAMTGTMFCQPATPVIYLAPIGWAEPFYLDLATVGGQHYNILAGPTSGDGPAYMSDFVVPLGPLYHRLTYMGYLETHS
ncbi:glycosyltransferase family 61 protein [Sphingobium sp. LF-16]|uniref:glycosyltransferase family 61 protein n=1 Tax=Sphingobium sp. LF-16 TaxID=2185111 RepID=UPI000F0859D6|nr:glycosyltransferase family 61 protein [Sphingobium sp. LF-16]